MVRILSAVLALALCACGAPPASSAPPLTSQAGVDPPPTPRAPPSIAPYAGNYTLEGETLEDGCAGEIVLLARGLEIDAGARTLRADVVDDNYEAHLEGDRLVATGRLDVPEGQCPDATVYERWELHRAADGGLDGFLSSTWLIWPSCMRVCTVRFAVRARPSAAGAPDIERMPPDLNPMP